MQKNMTHIELGDEGFDEQKFPEKKIFSLDSGLQMEGQHIE